MNDINRSKWWWVDFGIKETTPNTHKDIKHQNIEQIN